MIGQTAILLPVFVMVALTYFIWFVMFARRFALMKAKPPSAEDFATGQRAMAYFEPVEMPANNLRNLFEMPVLFYAIIPLLLITHKANDIQLTLAWAFALLRVVHSAIHIGRGPVIARFVIYALSCAMLLAMWIGLATDIISAG